ncbi:hypothetical protein SprV_0802490800 [Sparganum proliferum]
MLMDTSHDERPGIRIDYRTDAHLLSGLCIQASTRLHTTTIHELLFAADCARNTVTVADMQRSMELFVTGCTDFGFAINTDKTGIMRHSSPNAT